MDLNANLSATELAEIRDAILIDPIAKHKSILEARRWNDQTVRVRTGVVNGPLDAYGDWLLLQRTGDRWQITERGEWAS